MRLAISLLTIFLACGLLAAASQARAAGGQDAKRQAALRYCPQSSAALTDLTPQAWTPAESRVAAHRSLRSRLNAAMPHAPTMILMHGLSRHHLTYEMSTTAVRGSDGNWRIDTVGERRSGQLIVETQRVQEESRTLSAADGRKLDLLLRDRCLYLEPDLQFRASGVGFWFTTMEILTPKRRRIVAWAGESRGVTGAVADLIIGRGDQ